MTAHTWKNFVNSVNLSLAFLILNDLICVDMNPTRCCPVPGIIKLSASAVQQSPSMYWQREEINRNPTKKNLLNR